MSITNQNNTKIIFNKHIIHMHSQDAIWVNPYESNPAIE